MADDLTLVNFEGTLTDSTYVPNNKKENQFLFSAPPEYVSILADNGIEAVALENNHVMDHGEEVYLETQQHLTVQCGEHWRVHGEGCTHCDAELSDLQPV